MVLCYEESTYRLHVGAVFSHSITSMLLYYSLESIKILDGSGGQILSLSPLLTGNHAHATDTRELVALATAKSVSAMSMLKVFRVRLNV